MDTITRRPLYKLVAEQIKQHIIDNGLNPGDKLPTEKEMCQILGVSRSSVREAVKSLQSLGIIETKQREGIVVRSLGSGALVDYLTFGLQFADPNVTDLTEARAVVEIGILPLVASKAESEDFEDMERGVSTMESAVDNWSEYVGGDEAFHRALIRGARNKALSTFGDVVTKFFEITRERLQGPPSDWQRSVREHRAIIEALKKRDVAQATSILKRHLLAGSSVSTARRGSA